MPDYLPLCASRNLLLPDACRSCAWWQTSGNERPAQEAAAETRVRWIASLEQAWGPPGLLLQPDEVGSPVSTSGEAAGAWAAVPVFQGTAASITYAPAAAVPRLRDLPFGPLPPGSVVLCCMTPEGAQPRFQPKRLLHKALGQLKARGIEEVYAVGDSASLARDQEDCRFFALEILSANGFDQVGEDGGLVLMRVELRGLLALISQVQTAVRRVLRDEPTPSPAAWSRRQAS